MDQAAEDRQSEQPPGVRRRLRQLRVRVGDSVDRLGWPRPIVVGDVLLEHVADVVGAEEDEVIERLFPQGPHEPFDMRRGVGRAIGDGQPVDSHDFAQPPVELTTIAVDMAIPLDLYWPSELPEDAVVIVDEEAMGSMIPVASRICCLTQASVGFVVTLQ